MNGLGTLERGPCEDCVTSHRSLEERIAGCNNLPDPLHALERHVSGFTPSPPPKLNLGRKNDSEGICFVPRNL